MKLAAHERFALGVVALLAAVGGLVQLRSASEPATWVGDPAEPDATTSELVHDVEQEVERSRRRSRPLRPDEVIDVNTAVADEIQRLPRVGPALAGRIVAHREENGPFRSLADLGAVPGVGPALLAGAAPHLGLPDNTATSGSISAAADHAERTAPAAPTGSAPLPVDVNTAGVLELQRLPGVGPVLAQRIVDWRTANGPFRTVAELDRVPGIGTRTRERLAPLVRVGP